MIQTYKKRVFVETEYLGANVSCINTRKGLVLIDSPFLPEDAREWAVRIHDVARSELAFLINTDHHFDHVLGNGFLTDKVICHSTASRGILFLHNKEALLKLIQTTYPHILDSIKPDIDALPIPSPFITFERKLTLDMGDATIVLEFVGGHSPGTILISLLEDRVIFTGDNVEAAFPYFGQARFHGWKDTLRKILAMDVDMVVPGHGPVSGKESVERYLAFFGELEEEVKDFHREGLTVDEMVGKSNAIDFFPPEEIAQQGLSRAWVEIQYKTAARQILEKT